MNSAASVSGTPMGAALVSAINPTFSEGNAANAVPAPSSNAPEWLYWVRPDDVTDTLNPWP